MLLTTLTYVAIGLVAVCAILAWVFVIRHARTAWWESPGGRYLMRSEVATALLFSLTLLNRAVPLPRMGRVLLSVLLFSWIAYALSGLLLMQSQELRRARREADEARRLTDAG